MRAKASVLDDGGSSAGGMPLHQHQKNPRHAHLWEPVEEGDRGPPQDAGRAQAGLGAPKSEAAQQERQVSDTSVFIFPLGVSTAHVRVIAIAM